MPRFSANISMLFGELEFPERFEAAAGAGFKAVEIQFPYAWNLRQLAGIAAHVGVEVALINIPAGDARKGERGIACLPGRAEEFREGVARAIEYARALGCARMNCLAGVAPQDADRAVLRRTYVSNLRYAAGELAAAGMTLLVEPVSTHAVPGFFLSRSADAFALVDEVGADNLKVQYDLYHMRLMGDDLAAEIAANLGRIGHMQLADVPGRHEPGSGTIDFPALFDLADRLGYRGWIGAEYLPSGKTADSLAWAKNYL
ncbi:MAG TPA: hydroxypyruvate isomerase family protein [Burkholderiales bacterium]|nr:hydroxypyruvate isomerase family protein [Burkholderiales bacterium]